MSCISALADPNSVHIDGLKDAAVKIGKELDLTFEVIVHYTVLEGRAPIGGQPSQKLTPTPLTVEIAMENN